ncbi:probable methionine--tRNA ligase [Asparagus officinalis]|uniref:probable methionine--tRNA ligase n=1 Tax=Asparagus officinalis TaxID=4686 RepID=UPI00098DEBAF|nr:probable methionine--tRNA ligase [Asparagus officinalis]
MSPVSPFVYAAEHWFQFMPAAKLHVLRSLTMRNRYSLSYDHLSSLCDEKGDTEKAKRPWDFLPSGHKIGKPEPVFKEMKDEDVEFFRQKFAGSQSDRIEKVEAEAKIAEKLKSTKISEGNAKKQKVKSIGAAKPKPSEAEISVSRLDIRVGLIKKVQKHPDADIRVGFGVKIKLHMLINRYSVSQW